MVVKLGQWMHRPTAEYRLVMCDFLRSVLGVSQRVRFELWQLLRNYEIRTILGIYSLNKKIRKYRQTWTDHVERMHENNTKTNFCYLIQKEEGISVDQGKGGQTKECAMDFL